MAEKDTEKKEAAAKPKAETATKKPAAKKPAAKPKTEAAEKKTASKKPAAADKAAEKKKPAANPKAEAPAEKSAAERPAVKQTDASTAKAPAKGAAKLKITLIKSLSGRHVKHIATAKSLGLKKIGATALQPDNPQTRGKIAQIKYLVTVAEEK